MLRGRVKDRDGTPFDLALLSHDVAAVQSHMRAFGVTEALQS